MTKAKSTITTHIDSDEIKLRFWLLDHTHLTPSGLTSVVFTYVSQTIFPFGFCLYVTETCAHEYVFCSFANHLCLIKLPVWCKSKFLLVDLFRQSQALACPCQALWLLNSELGLVSVLFLVMEDENKGKRFLSFGGHFVFIHSSSDFFPNLVDAGFLIAHPTELERLFFELIIGFRNKSSRVLGSSRTSVIHLGQGNLAAISAMLRCNNPSSVFCSLIPCFF